MNRGGRVVELCEIVILDFDDTTTTMSGRNSCMHILYYTKIAGAKTALTTHDDSFKNRRRLTEWQSSF